MIEIIPTVVPASLAAIEAGAEKYIAFAGALHIDAADGLFAPNTTWMPQSDEHFATRNSFVYEAHLMVADPVHIGLDFIASGAERVLGHIEALRGSAAADVLAAWKSAGAKEVGLGILMDTPLEALDPVIAHVDMVQMMTISRIGVQGLPFDDRAPARVAQLHAQHPHLLISVDGGVNEETIAVLAKAGARRFCAGSVLSKSPDPAATYKILMELAEEASQMQS
jgi:ribulose-phosphate 3-epimerase